MGVFVGAPALEFPPPNEKVDDGLEAPPPKEALPEVFDEPNMPPPEVDEGAELPNLPILDVSFPPD